MELTSPGPTVGVVGGGQLGRMLGEAAGPLGVDVVVLDPTPDPPAAPTVRDTLVGDFDDPDGVRELAERADVLTYEIELADPELLARVSEETGVPVHPTPDTLRTIEDKLVQNRAFAGAGLPLPAFRPVSDVDELRAAGDELGWPVMLKARRGGYDGRGNRPVERDECETAMAEIGGAALVEELVDFERELAVIGVRGREGTDAFPLTETVQREEVLRESVAPARTSGTVTEHAREVALDVLDALDGYGVFGIELFEVSAGSREDGGRILVNEVAPRPHNSGHWTIEGCVTSQFEQHLRSVLGWPLGSTQLRGPTVTANLLADVDDSGPARLSRVEAVLSTPGAHLHWYGKREARPLRKMGHITVSGGPEDQRDVLYDRARELVDATTFR